MIKTTKGTTMTDRQMLDAILEAYTTLKNTIAAMPNASDKPEIMDCYEKELANLEYDFFTLLDEAVERAWTNATFDEDEEISIEDFLQ